MDKMLKKLHDKLKKQGKNKRRIPFCKDLKLYKTKLNVIGNDTCQANKEVYEEGPY